MNSNNPKRRVYRSKTRKVTACQECHRRKQKCDRKQPCNICSSRGVPDRCSYDHLAEHPPRHNREGILTESLDFQSPTQSNEVEDDVSDLTKRFGYNDAAARSAHALSEIQHFPGLNIVHRHGMKHKMSTLPKLSPQRQTQFQQLLLELPPAEVTQLLVDTFFNEANWYFCVLDQFYFDEALRHLTRAYSPDHFDLQIFDTPDTLYFPALLFQVLAMALQFVPPELQERSGIKALASPSFDVRSAIYSNAGETIMTLLGCRSGNNKTAVEADIMRCAWLKNSGNGLDAYYALGNAVRQAQDSALHLEPDEPDPHTTDPVELAELWRNEHRRRIWACLFTWEGHMAFQLGRPRMINAADCTVRAPIDTDIPLHPSRTLFRPTQPDEVPSRFTAQLIKYELARKIHKLMSLGAFTSSYTNYSTILTAHAEVEGLFQALPAALQLTPDGPLDSRWDSRYPTVIRHRLHIPIIINSFILAMHRPHIRTQSASLEAALKAARAVLDLSDELFWITDKHQHKTYTLVFYTIDAGLLLTVALLQRAESHVERMAEEAWNHACGSLRKAIIRLGILKNSNNAAATGQNVIQKCYDKILQTADLASSPDAQMQASSLDYQYQSVDTVLSGSTAIGGEPELSASLESLFDFEMLDDFVNNSAFTANWLDQYAEFEYSQAILTNMAGQISDQIDP